MYFNHTRAPTALVSNPLFLLIDGKKSEGSMEWRAFSLLYVILFCGTATATESEVPTPPKNLHTFPEGIGANVVSFTFEPSSSKLCTGHTVSFTATNPEVESRQELKMARTGRFGTVAGLFAGLEYNIEIVANGASGNSSPLIGKVTTKTAIPSGPPESLAAQEKSSRWCVVTWKDPHPATRGEASSALTYDLKMDGLTVIEGFSGHLYNFTGLKPRSKYTVSVLPRNSKGVCKDHHAGSITVTTPPVSSAKKHSEL